MTDEPPTPKIQLQPGIPMSSYLRGAIDSLGDATSIPDSTYLELLDLEESKKLSRNSERSCWRE
jgi:hypothetical protein